MVDATERATTTRTPMASRGGSHTIAHAAARARIDRATRRGSRTRDLRRRRPPRTHARRRSLRLALRGARGAVDAALGACWPCEESPIAPAGRPEQATGSVGDQGGAKIDSSVDHAVAGTLESAGRERAPRDRAPWSSSGAVAAALLVTPPRCLFFFAGCLGVVICGCGGCAAASCCSSSFDDGRRARCDRPGVSCSSMQLGSASARWLTCSLAHSDRGVEGWGLG